MPARRIVSLVPSQTELLHDLGLTDEVVGITKFCVHPGEWRSLKTIVGGTKNVDHEIVESLKPDLIIANREENTKEDVELLMKKYPVWVSDVATVEDACKMILAIADLTGTNGDDIIQRIKISLSGLPLFERKRALYMIWKKPWMAAGTDTFIHSMMKAAGFENVIDTARYPKLTDEEMVLLDPEVVLLSSEPYPFKEQHVEEVQKMFPAARVVVVNGEMFSWYGSRMLKAAGYFERLRLVF